MSRGLVLAAAALVIAACGRDASDQAGGCPGSCQPGAVLWSAVADGDLAAEVDAVAADPFGDIAIAGTSRGAVAIAPRASEGSNDQDPHTFATHLAMADGQADRTAPLDDAIGGGQGQALGGLAPDRTGGEVVLVIAPAADDRHELTAVLRDHDGAEVTRVALFRSAPADPLIVRTGVDRAGRPIAAVSGVDLERDGVVRVGPHTLIVRLGQALVPEVLADWTLTTVRGLVVGDGDDIAVVGDYVGQPQDLLAGAPLAAACAVPCGLAAVLHASGEVVQVASVVTDASASLDAVAFDPAGAPGAGAVVALGWAAGAADDPQVAAAVGPAFLARITGGEITSAEPLVAAGSSVVSRRLARGPRGLYLALTYNGVATVQGTTIVSAASDPRFDLAIAALGPNAPRWTTLLAGDGTIDVRALAVVGPVLVAAGAYDGTFRDLPSAPIDPGFLATGDGFVLAVGP